MTDNIQKSPESKKPIPDFASCQEEAEFWDSHDTIDYFEDTPVDLRFADDFKSVYLEGAKPSPKKPTQGITIKFPVDVLAKLRTQAAQKGIGATTFIRMVVLEALQREKEMKAI